MHDPAILYAHSYVHTLDLASISLRGLPSTATAAAAQHLPTGARNGSGAQFTCASILVIRVDFFHAHTRRTVMTAVRGGAQCSPGANSYKMHTYKHTRGNFLYRHSPTSATAASSFFVCVCVCCCELSERGVLILKPRLASRSTHCPGQAAAAAAAINSRASAPGYCR